MAAVGAFSPRVEVIRSGLCAVPTRGPSRYFGGDTALAGQVARAVAGVEGVDADVSIDAGVGVADGLFAAVLAARRAPRGEPVVVAPRTTADFLARWPVATLERPELADLLVRLGVHTLGRFAEVPDNHVLARFGADGVACHRVAKGIDGELPGMRVATPRSPHADRPPSPGAHQPGFFGGAAAAEARAGRAVEHVEELLGPEAVVMGKLQGGRGPGERARFVPFATRRTGAATASDNPPWPGQVPAPAPVVVYTRTPPALLADATGHPIGVTGGGMVSTEPARLSITGGAWVEVAGWAGPWPADERWWSTGRRRRARMQVLTADGAAHLLTRERGGWWLEGTYD
jgi:nucleotidyltransferase/DNA polymerase involved in DNA repair